ncbi:MAG: hypothetical protein H6706_27135 [Myxococcales bacterium]|nr:hypothetical protein [Myxococcales bacterium]
MANARTRALVALQADDQALAARSALAAELAAAQAEHQRWRELDVLIGAADGAKFRDFAQSLTLEAVLFHANRRLEELARRYQLMRVPGEDLAIQVIDREMGDEIRPVQSLSGGESFLVSLALALGLSGLSARDLRIESLFIDEGFGSLDLDTLDVVIDTLDTLQESGRQVGVISHVPGLAERLGIQVRVEPMAAGLSEVRIVTPR